MIAYNNTPSIYLGYKLKQYESDIKNCAQNDSKLYKELYFKIIRCRLILRGIKKKGTYHENISRR